MAKLNALIDIATQSSNAIKHLADKDADALDRVERRMMEARREMQKERIELEHHKFDEEMKLRKAAAESAQKQTEAMMNIMRKLADKL